MLPAVILHLLLSSTWQDHLGEEHYLPASYGADGFVHCSGTDDVMLAVANRYYRDAPTADGDELVVWEVDESLLRSEVRWEAPDPAPPPGVPPGTLFPHVYGPLELNAVVRVRRLVRDRGGTFVGYVPID
ncbi:MAG TPA: DUF952 domain-containing protein [Acidimicrobiales bacterium]